MTRKGAARTQHEPGLAREETEQWTGSMARPAENARDTKEPERRLQKRVRQDGRADQTGTQPDAMGTISAERAQWLEMIRALARGAAQLEHAAALRQRQVEANETGERE